MASGGLVRETGSKDVVRNFNNRFDAETWLDSSS